MEYENHVRLFESPDFGNVTSFRYVYLYLRSMIGEDIRMR